MEEKWKDVLIKFTPSQYEELIQLAEQESLSFGALVRYIVDYYFRDVLSEQELFKGATKKLARKARLLDSGKYDLSEIERVLKLREDDDIKKATQQIPAKADGAVTTIIKIIKEDQLKIGLKAEKEEETNEDSEE